MDVTLGSYLSSLFYSYFVLWLDAEVHWLSYMTAHWRKAGLVKRIHLSLLFLVWEGCIGFLRVQFNLLWSLRALLYSLRKKFLCRNDFLWMISGPCFIHNCINVEGRGLLKEAGDWSLFFLGHFPYSFAVGVECTNLMVVEFMFWLLNHGAFPVTAWEEHVLRLVSWNSISFLDLNWLIFYHWSSNWFHRWIWRSNGNWKVGAISFSHDGVRIVSWAVWFFIIERIFLIDFFNNFFWSRSFIEKILACEPSSFRLHSKTEVYGVSLILLSRAENIFNFRIMETLFILIAWVEVENRTFIIGWLLIAHFVNEVNWWEAFWFQELIDSVVTKFIMSFLVKDNVFKLIDIIFHELCWGV